ALGEAFVTVGAAARAGSAVKTTNRAVRAITARPNPRPGRRDIVVDVINRHPRWARIDKRLPVESLEINESAAADSRHREQFDDRVVVGDAAFRVAHAAPDENLRLGPMHLDVARSDRSDLHAAAELTYIGANQDGRAVGDAQIRCILGR